MPLEGALGHGGEGEVYAVAGQGAWAAKILYPARRQQNKHDKLQAMVARPPAGAYEVVEGFPVLTWPRAVLHTAPTPRGLATFQGYVMARVHPKDFVPFYQVTTPARRQGLGGAPITWDKMVLLALRLCHVVRTLHRFGYAVGDMNDRNVLVSRRFTPLLMDTDSFQVPKGRLGHFPSVVGDALFWPPELLDQDYATYRGSRVGGDRYALGVLLFQLFMGGFRPYQARGARVADLDSLLEKTRAGNFPWSSPAKGVLEPPVGAPAFDSIPNPIRRAFEQTFVQGHLRPGRRPSAEDWYRTLLSVHEAGYQTCARESRHVFGRSERACPWCRDANDPFGAPRVRVPPPSKVPRRRAPPIKAAPRKAPPRAAPRRAPPRTARKRLPARTAPKARPAKTGGRAPPLPKPPPARLPLRALWLVAVAFAFSTPAWALRQLPPTVEKHLATGLVTTAVLLAAFTLASWPWLRTPRQRVAAVSIWLAPAVVLTAWMAHAGWWTVLDYTTGVASFALGSAAFVLLERRRPRAFQPRRQGFLHGAAGLPASYLPTGAIWLLTRP